MNMQEAERAVWHGLKQLPWRRYLAAMWILGGELQSLYAAQLTDEDLALMAATLDLVREAAAAGVSAEAAERAGNLTRAWLHLQEVREKEASPGLLNTRITFRDLAAEIGGLESQYNGASCVTNAVTDLWRVLPPGFTGPIVVKS